MHSISAQAFSELIDRHSLQCYHEQQREGKLTEEVALLETNKKEAVLLSEEW